MTPIPTYQYKIASGLNNAAGLVNIEQITADSGITYFRPPAIRDDSFLTAVIANGQDYERGYASVTWVSKMTWDQYAYFLTTYLSGNNSGYVTFATKRGATNAYSNLQAVLKLDYLGNLDRNYTMLQNVTWAYRKVAALGAYT